MEHNLGEEWDSYVIFTPTPISHWLRSAHGEESNITPLAFPVIGHKQSSSGDQRNPSKRYQQSKLGLVCIELVRVEEIWLVISNHKIPLAVSRSFR